MPACRLLFRSLVLACTQDPGGDSDWKIPEAQDGAGWTDKDIKAWLHKLGNLCVLTVAQNSGVSNSSFNIKQKKLFGEPMIKGSAAGLTAVGLADKSIWNPAAVRTRQADLLAGLASRWDFEEGWTAIQSTRGTVGTGDHVHTSCILKRCSHAQGSRHGHLAMLASAP